MEQNNYTHSNIFKNFFWVSVITAFCFTSFVQITNAQQNFQERKEMRKENIQERRDVRKDNFQEKKENRIENIQERKDVKIENLTERKKIRREKIAERKVNLKDRISDRRINLKEKFASSTNGIRKRFTGHKKEIVRDNLDKIFARFDAALERLEGLAERMQSKIEELESDGIDTSNAQGALDDATDLIDQALVEITAVKQAIRNKVENEEELTREGLRELMTSAKESLKAAHSGLRNVISELKDSDSDS